MAWKEFFIYTFNGLPLATGTANANPSALSFTEVVQRIDNDSDFEVIRSVHKAGDTGTADDRVYIKIFDTNAGRYLMRDATPLAAVSGSALTTGMATGTRGFASHIWAKPYQAAGATSLVIQWADFSGTSRNVRLSLQGNKVRQGTAPWEARKYQAQIPMTYVVNIEALAANASTTAAVSIDVDSDFMVQKITGIFTGAASLVLADGGRERWWMDKAVYIDTIVGNGQFPFVMTSPRFIYRGSPLSVNISDLSGATNTIRLVFHGVKLYG